MTKINILLKDETFAQDLEQQISQYHIDLEICLGEPDSSTTLLLTDADNSHLSQIIERYKELPIVLFADKKSSTDYADLIIEKPFKLAAFLEGLKENKLLPKVRRKECFVFKEYTLYPVKKEIFSATTQKTTKLTEKEIDIIKYLYQAAPVISSKEDLLENVWGYSSDATTHTVETHIYRLRQKVEKDGSSQLIITENNGYRLNI